eukprot:1150379-Pelagomonas_calceolata.AAC.9
MKPASLDCTEGSSASGTPSIHVKSSKISCYPDPPLSQQHGPNFCLGLYQKQRHHKRLPHISTGLQHFWQQHVHASKQGKKDKIETCFCLLAKNHVGSHGKSGLLSSADALALIEALSSNCSGTMDTFI